MLIRFILIFVKIFNAFEYKLKKIKDTRNIRNIFEKIHFTLPINFPLDQLMSKTILLRILFTFLLIQTTQYFKRKAKIRVGARLIVWDTLLLVFFFFFFFVKITLPVNRCAGKRSPNRTILRHNGGTICNADTWLKGWHSRGQHHSKSVDAAETRYVHVYSCI